MDFAIQLMRFPNNHIIFWIFILLPGLSFSQVILNVMSLEDSSKLYNVSVYDVYGDSLICKINASQPCKITTGKDLFIECKYRGFEDLYLTIKEQTKDTLNLYMRKSLAIEAESLDEIMVTDATSSYLRDIDGMGIYAARKTERIDLDKVAGNKAIGIQRQIYAKIAGLNVWESSGSGLNTEIGARGLNPARSSNFNVRQNQYDIAADAIGYPDAYYVPPAEAIKRIDIIRGASSLQYGPQFGGTINYHLKGAELSSGWRHEVLSSIGSFGLFNQSLGFGYGGQKIAFYTFSNYRQGNGWRPNSGFQVGFNHSQLAFLITKNWTAQLEHTTYLYEAQQPGGLTDALFAQNPNQSIRSRNYFRVYWYLPALTLNGKIGKNGRFNTKLWMLRAGRDAVGFLGNIARVDLGENRDLLRDTYKNIGHESRYIGQWTWADRPQSFLLGIRNYFGNTTKRQGLTDSLSSASYNYLSPNIIDGSQYEFPSINHALFAEHIFRLPKSWKIVPGIRYEIVESNGEGSFRQLNTDLAGNILFDTIINETFTSPRSFFLLGIGVSKTLQNGLDFYANWSQNYRAINFNDLRIVNPNFRIDPNLKDERGYNMDVGFRGNYNGVQFDITAYYLRYANRIGFLLEVDSQWLTTYRFRTNVGQSNTYGFESLLEIDWLQLKSHEDETPLWSLITMVNYSYSNGRYALEENPAIDGKKIELVPQGIFRSSFTLSYDSRYTVGAQWSWTGEQFADATNATFSPDAVHGLIPSYQILDIYMKARWKQLSTEINLNNALNTTYFTRRASGYPGPGILPSDPRNITFSLGWVF